MTLRINDLAPDFEALTTHGPIRFHEWLGNCWCVLFSHPKDFTPVCTTELGRMAGLEAEFARRNCKIIGLSVDPVEDHLRWASEIEKTQGHKVSYPMIGDFDLKHRRGGMIDIEFIAQFLQLREAARRPDLLQPNTRMALLALAAAGAVARESAGELVSALALWRDLQNILRLTVGEPFAEDDAAPAVKTLIAQSAGADDFETLREDMEAKAERAFAWYERIIAAPAEMAVARREATSDEKEKAP